MPRMKAAGRSGPGAEAGGPSCIMERVQRIWNDPDNRQIHIKPKEGRAHHILGFSESHGLENDPSLNPLTSRRIQRYDRQSNGLWLNSEREPIVRPHAILSIGEPWHPEFLVAHATLKNKPAQDLTYLGLFGPGRLILAAYSQTGALILSYLHGLGLQQQLLITPWLEEEQRPSATRLCLTGPQTLDEQAIICMQRGLAALANSTPNQTGG